MAFNKDQKRVIFLDIDGPLIPSGMFLVDRRASWERKFSPISLACVRELCKRTNAKIVFNTTHIDAAKILFSRHPSTGSSLLDYIGDLPRVYKRLEKLVAQREAAGLQ